MTVNGKSGFQGKDVCQADVVWTVSRIPEETKEQIASTLGETGTDWMYGELCSWKDDTGRMDERLCPAGECGIDDWED